MSLSAMTVAGLGIAPDEIVGLDPAAVADVRAMLTQWAAKVPRNAERTTYMNMENRLSDLGAVLPKQLVDKLGVVSGWAPKAVHEMSHRINLDGITWPDSRETDPYGVLEVLEQNQFGVEFPQAVTSELTHSCVFATVTPGDTALGQPEELIQFHSAMWATGIWDRRLRRLRAGLVVNELDSYGRPVMLTIFRMIETVVIAKMPSGAWAVVWVGPNTAPSGRIPMEMLAFRPDLDRPFGRSRIDRTVMSLVDRALRTGSRLEVHSELYSTMKLILLGVDENQMQDADGNTIPLWSFMMDRVNTVGWNEDSGQQPTVQQVTAQSPEPHIAVMRQLAVEFSGHTGVSLSSLGVFTDNAESADAKREARDDVVADAERQHIHLGHALHRIFENIAYLKHGEVPKDFDSLQLIWRRPDRLSLASMADAATKIMSTHPELQGTEVGYEISGLSPDQIRRVQQEKKLADARGLLDRVVTGGGAGDATEDQLAEIEALKLRFDALGVAIRAGVTAESAMRAVGLENIEFTGDMPASLRPREEITPVAPAEVTDDADE